MDFTQPSPVAEGETAKPDEFTESEPESSVVWTVMPVINIRSIPIESISIFILNVIIFREEKELVVTRDRENVKKKRFQKQILSFKGGNVLIRAPTNEARWKKVPNERVKRKDRSDDPQNSCQS